MKRQGQLLKCVVLVAFIFLSAPLYLASDVYADNFSTRRLAVSDSLVAASDVQYHLSFSGQSAGNVGSLRIQLCSNNPFPGTSCTQPEGLDARNTSILNQSGMTGFTVYGSLTTENEIVLTRIPGPTDSGLTSIELSGITNPTNPGTYYVRLESFATTDASGPSHDASGLAIDFQKEDLSIHTYVPPYLEFCIGNTIPAEDCAQAEGNYIDLGELSHTKTTTGQTKLLVGTNADYGYSISVVGTTLTSGINTIPALSSPDVSRTGVSQFGINLRSNSTPASGAEPSGMGRGQPTVDYNSSNLFKFASGDVIAGYSGADYYRKYTVDYIVNVSKTQPAGVYVTTLTYVAYASF